MSLKAEVSIFPFMCLLFVFQAQERYVILNQSPILITIRQGAEINFLSPLLGGGGLLLGGGRGCKQ